ncbi:MAG TPA: hypothetical protein VKW77_00210, partial [Acidimicrobiales bacterium]|nr:hypothetical protein [Acidimicrobiales bacterium]
LLIDSDGRGGFHIWVVFGAAVPNEDAYRLGRWLAADHAGFGLMSPPEHFPKRPRFPHGKIGSWVRLFGRHHTRPWWSRIWGGTSRGWLAGRVAAAEILATAPAAVDLAAILPPEAPRARGALLPREELDGLEPLEKVRTQLDALGLKCEETADGLVAQCPHHVGDRLNFEARELQADRRMPGGRVFPAGTVLVCCQAYHDVAGPGGCGQDNVIRSLGLRPRDLFPEGEAFRPRRGAGRRPRVESPPPRPPLTEGELERWSERASRFEAAIRRGRARRLDELADRLGVPSDALARFHVGWRADDRRRVGDHLVPGRCWTIPERDGRERITGINRRYEDGTKRAMPGTRRGLYVPDGWREMPGPVFVPEGFSDAAALVAVGACAIGRPSVGAGVDELIELLGGDARSIVILGENDAKPALRDGEPIIEGGKPVLRHPGYVGAVAACRRLRAALGRDDVAVKMPPDRFKDVRELLSGGGLG